MIMALSVAAFSVAAAFRSGDDDPKWELRWRSLDPEARARISVAARAREWGGSASKLIEPEGIELALGLRRRDRRRRAYVEVALAPFLVVAAYLTLIGLLEFADFGFIVVVSGLISGLYAYLRAKHMSGAPRPMTSPDAGL